VACGRNEHAVEIVFLQDFQHAQHVDVAVVDKRLAIVRHFVADVAEVNVPQLLLAAVLFDGVVDIASVISARLPRQNSSALLRLGCKSNTR